MFGVRANGGNGGVPTVFDRTLIRRSRLALYSEVSSASATMAAAASAETICREIFS